MKKIKEYMLCLTGIFMCVCYFQMSVLAEDIIEETDEESMYEEIIEEDPEVNMDLYEVRGETVNIALDGIKIYSEAYEVCKSVNVEREKAGLEELIIDECLMENAMLRAAESVVYYSHLRPNGMKVSSMISGKLLGENISNVDTTAEDVVTAWMNSDGHRENILTNWYDSIGVGCFETEGIRYWSVLFGYNYGYSDRIDAMENYHQDIETSVDIEVLKNRLELYILNAEDQNWTDWETIGSIEGAVNDNISIRVAGAYVNEYGYREMFILSPESVKLVSEDENIVVINESGGTVLNSTGTTVIYAELMSNPSIRSEIIPVSVQDNTLKEYPNTDVYEFVQNLYQRILNRNADDEGLQQWYQQLTEGSKQGVDAAWGFVFSDEYLNKHTSDMEYVTTLYQAFLQRDVDEEGLKNWTGLLKKGMSRCFVYAGFANSEEFKSLCRQYQIESGEIKLYEPEDQSIGVTEFVFRCYDIFLNRIPDQKGLKQWTANLLNGNSAKEIVKGFIFSPEFESYDLSHNEYIEKLYMGFFDRPSDPIGAFGWITLLNMGENPEKVFEGFADSDEFRCLVEQWGLCSQW